MKVGDAVNCYGFEFLWTEHHLKGGEMQPWRALSDDKCDAVLAKVSVFFSSFLFEFHKATDCFINQFNHKLITIGIGIMIINHEEKQKKEIKVDHLPSISVT